MSTDIVFAVPYCIGEPPSKRLKSDMMSSNDTQGEYELYKDLVSLYILYVWGGCGK